MKFGLLYEPRFVIWQWYGNDFNDDYGMALMNGELSDLENQEPEFEPAMSQKSASGLWRWLESNSAVYWIVQTAVRSEEELYIYQRFVDPYRVQIGEGQMYFGRPYTMKAFDMNSSKNQQGLAISQDTILKAQSTLADMGIPLVIVLIPTKEEVYGEWIVEELGEIQLEAISEGRR
ncbi:MAG: hypothetical protein GWN30_18930, partial [Gammaproteobacteria bacterium]|nr:hypothetical protein [Gammaproteobacteria bacterium]